MTSGLDSFMPPIISARWSPMRVPSIVADQPNQETLAYRNVLDGLQVFFSLEDRGEDGIWLHLSMSTITGGRPVPSWAQLKLARETFIGDEVCIQVLPKKKDWLNAHGGVLHLFRRVDAPTIPPIWDHA